MSFVVDLCKIQPSADELTALVRGLAERSESYQGVDERSEPRRLLAAPASVQVLTDDLEVDGPPMQMVIRDISSHGIGLLHSSPVSANFLSLELDDRKPDLLIRVLRCRQVGAYYDIGGRVLTHRDLLTTALKTWKRHFQRFESMLAKLDDTLDEMPQRAAPRVPAREVMSQHPHPPKGSTQNQL